MATNAKQLFLSLVVIFGLSACSTMPSEFGGGDPVKPLTQTERAMMSARNAALELAHEGIKKGELTKAEAAYRNAPYNVHAAISYARLLRRVKMVEQADLIMSPFVLNVKTAKADAILEYAKIKIEQGDFMAAQNYTQDMLGVRDSAQMRLVLGVAVDAQGHHQSAENHFKQGLVHLSNEKDSYNVRNALLNNLALSLLAQDKVSEAEKVMKDISIVSSRLNQNIINDNKRLADRL